MDDNCDSFDPSMCNLGSDGVNCIVDPRTDLGMAGLVHWQVECLGRKKGLLGVDATVI